MPRRLKIDRPVRVEVQLPESVASKVRLELWSDLESRVPTGAMSELATRLFEDWLKTRGVQI